MPKVALYNIKGEQVGEIELKNEVFGVEPNEGLIHDVVVMQLANRRVGTASTKTRAEVAGGGRKPWKQKGTGRARHGSIRSPIWKGGGITFGPQPRSYRITMPKKARRLALKSALSSKVLGGNIIVLENLELPQPKTKEMAQVLDALKVNKALVVTSDVNLDVVRSARNIPGVTPTHVGGINVYDLVNHDKLVITKDAVAKVEEVLA